MIKRKHFRSNRTISIIVKFFLVLTIIGCIKNGFWHLMSINILLLFLLFLPGLMKKRYRVKFPVEFEFILILFTLLTLFVGKIGGVLVPLFFGIAISFTGFIITLILYADDKIKKDPFFVILFSFSLSITAGIAIELSKFYLKIILGYEMNDPYYSFSMKIMTYVAMGALFSAMTGYMYMKGKLNLFRKVVERFESENPFLKRNKDMKGRILEIIKEGESERVEFKSTLRKNLYTKDIDRNIENSALKTIASFLNSNGGFLIIGVSDNGDILGLKEDNFENKDKFLLHLNNLIKERIGKNFIHLINSEIIEVNGKEIAVVSCLKSDKPVFLKINNREEFYIRSGPSSIKIEGSYLLDYFRKRFE